MHSMPISEPVGLVVGGVGGVIGAMIGEAIGESGGELTKRLCGAAGATAGHYVASHATKIIIGATMLDPVGPVLATGTSAASAAVHGAGYLALNHGFE